MRIVAGILGAFCLAIVFITPDVQNSSVIQAKLYGIPCGILMIAYAIGGKRLLNKISPEFTKDIKLRSPALLDNEQIFIVRRVHDTTILKLNLIGAFIVIAIFAILYSIMALLGVNTIVLNGQPIHDAFTMEILAKICFFSIFFVVLISGLINTGLWIFSLISTISIRVIIDKNPSISINKFRYNPKK